MKEDKQPVNSDIIFESIDLGRRERSESGRLRAVRTFQGEKGDLVSISLKPGYKVGKDSTGKKLMMLHDPDDNYQRRLAGIVTWLSNHYAAVGLISGIENDEVDLEIEVPLQAIDSYRALTADMNRKYMI